MLEKEIESNKKKYKIIIYHGHTHLIPIENSDDELEEDFSSNSS